jgi:nucleoid DNA-binding protein
MRKCELIKSISERSGIVQGDVELVVNATIDVLKERLAAGHSIKTNGFGTFGTRTRPEKIGRLMRGTQKNPIQVIIPESTIVFFKPSKNII